MALLTKARLRRINKVFLKRIAESGTAKQKEAANLVLSNDTIKEAVEIRLLAEFKIRDLARDKKIRDAMANSSDTPILDWLWEHREEIIKFIMQIIALFSTV